MLSLIRNDMFDDRKQENKMQILIMKNGHIILLYNGKFKTLESHDTAETGVKTLRDIHIVWEVPL